MSQKSVFIAFVIFVFLQTKHRYIHDVSNEIIYIVNSIIVTNRRSARLSINRKRIIKTFEFVESIHFSIEWILKLDFFVNVVRSFHVAIEQYRQTRIYQNFLLIARSSSSIDITSNRSTMQKRSVISKTSKTTEEFFASRSKRFRHEHVAFVQNRNNFKTFNYSSLIERSNSIDTIIIDSNQSANNESNSIDNTRRINEINAEKIIHHQFIDSDLHSINNHNMSDRLNSIVQIAIDVAVDNAIKRVTARLQQRQQSSSNDETDDETDDDDYVEKTETNENINRSVIQFFQNVEYFDLKYKNLNDVTNIDVLIVNNDRQIFYRDVYMFIDKLKNLIKNSIDEQRVRELLSDCLKKKTFVWKKTKCNDDTKKILREIILNIWYIYFLRRFKSRASVALTALQKKSYIIIDVKNDRISKTYVQSILRHARFAEFTSSFNQMTLIWNKLNIEFRVHIFEFKSITDFNIFLDQLDEKIDIWHDLTVARQRFDEKKENFFDNINVDKNNRSISKQQRQNRQNEFFQSSDRFASFSSFFQQF